MPLRLMGMMGRRAIRRCEFNQMSRQAITPDHLFDRPWRPGRRYAQRSPRGRRVAMLVLLLCLWLIIGGYVYITDTSRVRKMAESYLSDLIGGPVKVGGATLSIFEGLRLDDVKVYVDDQTHASDALVFAAQTLVIKYDPRTMLTGNLEATQLIAQKPQVFLAENRDTNEWNYQRLVRRRRAMPRPAPTTTQKAIALPEVLLRNARVTISEIRGGREVARGLMVVDGGLGVTNDPDRYGFHLQSRGALEGLGPYATGSISLSTGHLVAQLMNFEFDRDVRSMLPAEPREWWRYHALAGAVSMPEINFTPPRDDKPEQFKIVTVLNGVTLSVSPEEWMSRTELKRLESMRQSVALLRPLYAWSGRGPSIAPPARMAKLLTPSKIALKNVAGSFVFTSTGIDVKNVSGFVESNGFAINGRIGGYRPDAPLSLSLSSLDTANLIIQASPLYLHSLPREVREVYDQFKPEGECRLAIRVDRPEAGDRPIINGEVKVLDGRFVFNRFPYPLRNVTGKIGIGHANDGSATLSLDVRGNGPATGPNRDTVLQIRSFGDGIGPIGTNICGVNVRISGENVASEDILRNAFPPEVREALNNFDAHRTGKYPQFRGDFVTEVVRPVGYLQRWSFDTDIALKDASGSLSAFPYPLSGLAGKLLVRSGYVELADIHTASAGGSGTLTINGRYAWKTSDGPRGPQPQYRARDAQLSPRVDEAVVTELKVMGRGLSIDNDLITALPRERRDWLRKLGINGKVDVDGRVYPSKESEPKVEWVVGNERESPDAIANVQDVYPAAGRGNVLPMAYDLKLSIRDGSLRPFGGTFEATDASASLHLTPERLIIERATAKRGDGELSVGGTIDFAAGNPRVVLDGSAKLIKLDDPLYALLPEAGKRAWDETQPQGTLDAEVHYVTSASAAATKPAEMRVTLKPRDLAATLKSMPYRLEKMSGTIAVEGNRVTLEEVSGQHGEGKITVSGTGALGAASIWDVRVVAEKLAVDDELRTALPKALSGLFDSIKLKGAIGCDFTKFVYRGAAQTSADKPGDPEVDVVGSVNFIGAALDVGVPITDAQGAMKIDAAIREGHLETLSGGLDFPAMSMAGRITKNFRADLFKPAGRTELRISKMRGEIAGGAMSGDMTLIYPDDGPSRYALELVVRDADAQALAWEKDDGTMKGRLTASLSLEGSWGDAAQRRGRGDVIVRGKELKRIPLVLGLLQVTNLALPISSPFNEATAVYNLEGSRVIFDQIKLSAKNMLMEGNGTLDFATKKVDLVFTTDNPNGLMQIPFIKELWRNARNEMLKIRVTGTIQEPSVKAQSMGTFWTTVDEVFDARKKPEK
jgi:hypothetical protein